MTDSVCLNFFEGVQGVEPMPREMTLDQLAEFLTPIDPPRVTREERKLKQLFSMNIYKEGTTRKTENVEFMTGVVFDFDNKNDYVSIGTVLKHLKDKRIAYAWYTTHSHTESRPKWRLIIPFASPLPVSEWLSVYQQCVLMIGNPPGIDHAACKDVAHMWFPPYRNVDQPYSADSDLEASFIEPLDIELYLTPEEQAQYKALTQERPQAATVLPFPDNRSVQVKSAFTIGQAMSAVGFIRVESADYEQWLNIGMALHHQFSGSEIAFKVWDLWSSQSPHYNKEGLLKKWQSFADNKEKSVGIGTLIRMAQKEGFDPARESVEKTPRRLIKYNLRQFLSQDIPPLKMILDPIIPEQGLVMLYAPRGIGKTYLSLSIAYIVAAGKHMLDGKWKTEKENKVLFVDGEMPAGRLQERLAHLVMSAGELSNDDLLDIITPDFQDMGGIPDLSKVEGQKLIEQDLEGVKLLILDNLSSLFRTGSENEAESWKSAQEWFLTLRRRGISVLLVHHAGKSGNQRGTSKKEDLLDTVISLRRPEDYDPGQGARFEVHYEKARGFYGEDARPFEVQLVEKDDQYFWTVKEMDECQLDKIIELHQLGLKQRDIASEMKISLGAVNKKIQKAKEGGKI